MAAIAPWMDKLGIRFPIIQAPMTGTSSPALAAAVSQAGGLGSIGLGAYGLEQAQAHIEETQRLTQAPVNINLFCHASSHCPPEAERAWLRHLAPDFLKLKATPPWELEDLYPSVIGNQALQAMVLAQRPKVVSFHFGLPEQSFIQALKKAGCLTMATATCLEEALQIEQAGIDVLVAQGVEAGGHRGVFQPERDQYIGTFALVQLLARHTGLPVVAAGGIMNGAGIAAALQLGACAAQMGTAFVSCPESLASPAYRAALASPKAMQTRITSAISGRPARGIVGRMHELGDSYDQALPPYPWPYFANKALQKAAEAQQQMGYAPYWAGQGAALARSMPAAELVKTLVEEWFDAREDWNLSSRPRVF